MGRRILVADDSITVRKSLQAFLIEQGHEVVAVGNGDLATRRAGEMRPELALIDILMPGKNGYEVCRHIKQTLGLPIPVILLRSDFEPFDTRESVRSGADQVLLKPIDQDQLLSAILESWIAYGFTDEEEPPPPEASWSDVAEDVAAIPEVEDGLPSEFLATHQDMDGFLSPDVMDSGVSSTAVPARESWESTVPDQPSSVSPPSPQAPWEETAPAADVNYAASAWTSPAPVSPWTEASAVSPAQYSETPAVASSVMTVTSTVVPTPSTRPGPPTAELEDPFTVVARGEYKSFFKDLLRTTGANEAVSLPTDPAFIEQALTELSDEDAALFAAMMGTSVEGLRQRVSGISDPHPTPNPFAPLPPVSIPTQNFVVPLNQTTEIAMDPTGGATISFDQAEGTVQIHGLVQKDGSSLAVSEVEIPYAQTGEFMESVPTYFDDRRAAWELNRPTLAPSTLPASGIESGSSLDFDEVDVSSTPEEVIEALMSEFEAEDSPTVEEMSETGNPGKAFPEPVVEVSTLTEFLDNPGDVASEAAPLALEDVMVPTPVVETINTDPFANSLFEVPIESNLAVCIECGSPATEGDIFCRVCNTALPGTTGSFEAIRVESVSMMVCRHCGAGINHGDVFCLKCGEVI
ncbi:MAG: response regulator [Acidobacteria bacterium]|nr:response regulator [Acidobacteriota bacterium]